ncbi:response regulator transcription factor [Oceanicella sp. SM1341]|uniref:response regulator transcription factor n=1 Tax=Oceanicella sp. SM1341 TaxID=1548889 RepID=UPI000E4D8D52|nr:response regulator transcription factor [Oceanicella sp. SM1341]
MKHIAHQMPGERAQATPGRSSDRFAEADPPRDLRSARQDRVLSIIDGRRLERACLVHCLEQLSDEILVAGYDSPDSWQAAQRPGTGREVILYALGGRAITGSSARAELSRLVQAADPTPVIVLAATDDLETMLAALDCGAVGFFPPDVKLETLIEGTCITAAGGIFLPRDSLPSLREAIAARPAPRSGLEARFTDRQLAVARALQRGAANKTIAYELNLCESTVKVHIRKIMRALNATNRTQAAFKLNAMSREED